MTEKFSGNLDLRNYILVGEVSTEKQLSLDLGYPFSCLTEKIVCESHS